MATKSSAGGGKCSAGVPESGCPSRPIVSGTVQIPAEIHAPWAKEQQDSVIGVERPCGMHMALQAVEFSFSASQLDEYNTAYVSCIDSHLAYDRLYLTWKGLKDADRGRARGTHDEHISYFC